MGTKVQDRSWTMTCRREHKELIPGTKPARPGKPPPVKEEPEKVAVPVR